MGQATPRTLKPLTWRWLSTCQWHGCRSPDDAGCRLSQPARRHTGGQLCDRQHRSGVMTGTVIGGCRRLRCPKMHTADLWRLPMAKTVAPGEIDIPHIDTFTANALPDPFDERDL